MRLYRRNGRIPVQRVLIGLPFELAFREAKLVLTDALIAAAGAARLGN